MVLATYMRGGYVMLAVTRNERVLDVMSETVLPGSRLVADESAACMGAEKLGYRHEPVSHKNGECARRRTQQQLRVHAQPAPDLAEKALWHTQKESGPVRQGIPVHPQPAPSKPGEKLNRAIAAICCRPAHSPGLACCPVNVTA